MAVVCNAWGDFLKRTTGLPSETLFTLCGWALKSDAYAFQDGVAGVFGVDSRRYIRYSADGVLSMLHGAGTSVDFAASPTNNTWFFWAMTCNGTSLKGYWAAPSSSAWGGTLSLTTSAVGATGEVCIGAAVSSQGPVGGSIAAVKLWDAELSSAELEAERLTYRPQRLTNLHLWSPLLVDSLDYSGAGKNWTEAGTLTWEDGPPIGWGASPLIIQSGVTATVRKWFFGRIS